MTVSTEQLHECIAVLGPILPGSIVMVPDSMLDEGGDTWVNPVEQIAKQLEAAAGHRKFVLVAYTDDQQPVRVLSPDDSRAIIRALVTDILAESE
jgi:hypothetical protein